MDRRAFLTASLSAGLTGIGPAARARPRGLRVTLLGQSLIEHGLPDAAWPGRAAIAARLAKADVVFTNLETVIRGARAGAPTREALTLHAGDRQVLETLKGVHVNLLATASNHAFDLGSGGVLDTLDAIASAGLPSAGSGVDLARAAAPAYRVTPAGGVGLVAAATGKIREGGAAAVGHPGVNVLRRDTAGNVIEADSERILHAIRLARRGARTVVVYHHNHDWEPDMAEVPAWQRAFAHLCVEAGATVFVGHGAPILQGIEMHRGAPLFFGLGNFIFQTEKPPGAYPPEAWESVVAECAFERGRCIEVRLAPVVLNETGLAGAADLATRGAPTFAVGEPARAILGRLATRSIGFGTRLEIEERDPGRPEGWIRTAG
jgi:poly-gamma-glutamate synthesis protein (capsule biosynthesis protein)